MTLNPGMPFLPNWHIRAIAYQLERVRRGEVNRLSIAQSREIETAANEIEVERRFSRIWSVQSSHPLFDQAQSKRSAR